MTVSLLHAFQSSRPQTADASIVGKNEWNAEHSLSMASSRVLGRLTSGAGEAEELSKTSLLDWIGFGINIYDTETYVSLQAAITASAGKALYIPAGEYTEILTGVSNIEIYGDGPGRTILKRPPNSVGNNSVLSFTSKNGFKVRDLTIDGNKDNQTDAASNMSCVSCYNYELDITTINAKTSGGSYGSGLILATGTNAANYTHSKIKVVTSQNEASGLYITQEQNLDVWVTALFNDGDGVTVVNGALPANPTEVSMVFHSPLCMYNNAGFAIYGYEAETANPTARNISIVGGNFENNTNYGYVNQSKNVACVGATIRNNGSDGSNGNVLFNATDSTLVGCTISDAFYFNIDAGGSLRCIISDCTIVNGGSLALGCSGISAGGVQDLLISNCAIYLNSASTNGGAGIAVYDIDGGGEFPAFALQGARVKLHGNRIYRHNNNQFGISVGRGNPLGFEADDNTVYGGTTADRAFSYEATGISIKNNKAYVSSSFALSVASATDTIIPDDGELITISGTTSITNLYTIAQNAYLSKVRYIEVTNGGSGYVQASTTATLSGYTLSPLVVGGVIRSIRVDTVGGTFGSDQAITIGGVGSSGAATGRRNCYNGEGRIVTLYFSDAVTVSNGGGNITLSGAFTSAAGYSLTLRGTSTGTWQEISRSKHSFSGLTDSLALSQLPSATGTFIPTIAASVSVDFNSANTDHTLTFSLPSGCSRWRVSALVVHSASASISTATVGIFTSTGGGGVTVAANQAITVTTASDATNNNAMSLTATNGATTTYTTTTVYVRVGTAQGSPATGKVTLSILVFP